LKLKRLISVFATCAIAAAIVSGCTKSSSSDQSSTASAGPVTDSASTGMKPQEKSGGAVAMGDAKHGSAIFSQNCSSCHGAAGAGGNVGPTLKGEKGRKDYAEAVAWIKNPKPPMPKLYPSPLSDSDVADVAAYVESL